MVDKSMNGTYDLTEEKFWKLKAHAAYISHYMNILTSALSNKLQIFGEYGGYNVEDKSQGILGDWEETQNQLKKEHEKDQPNSSVINHSQSLFKME